MQRTLFGMVLLVLICSSANAALLSRLSGQAYYDDVLNLTWIADANLADSNTFGVLGINANGTMNWAKANEWIAAMNTAAYLGKSDWRLPTVTDTGTPGCNLANTGTDCGWNVNLATGEMAHMYYSTLGNTGYLDTSGVETGGPCLVEPNLCLTNDGPFSNLQPDAYWSGTEYAPDASLAWILYFESGFQGEEYKDNSITYAWAVRPGDIAPVPVPGAVWLFGGALALLSAVRRRAMTALG